MKNKSLIRIATTLALFILTSLPAYAQVQMGAGVAETSINADASAAPVTGTAFAVSSAITQINWTISFASAPASHTTVLQTSNDNSIWATADTSTNVNGESRNVFTSAKFVRVVESARSGGSAITATVVGKTGANVVLSAGATTTGSLTSTGVFLGSDGTAPAPTFSFTNSTNTGTYLLTPGTLAFSAASGNIATVWNDVIHGFQLANAIPITWGTQGGTPDLYLFRDGAAGTLAQRNLTNTQTFRLYNTFTDAANYERLAISFSSGNVTIGHQFQGTGSSRTISLDSASGVQLRTGGTVRWAVDNSGNLLAGTDNSWDIGASGASRPRSIFAGLQLVLGNAITATTSAPTIVSGFGGTPSIVNNNGSSAFTINVGSGGVATSGVIGLTVNTTGWNCFVIDRTTNIVTRETSTTTTQVTLTAASAWGANDILQVSCFGY